jgi:hypothetical protein
MTTVRELIEWLSNCDADSIVDREDSEFGPTDIALDACSYNPPSKLEWKGEDGKDYSETLEGSVILR